MAASTWVFLRHGECQGNVARLLVAPDDTPLTDLGWKQARSAATLFFRCIGLSLDHTHIIDACHILLALGPCHPALDMSNYFLCQKRK